MANGVIIQCRLGSSRLPCKAMLDLAGKTLLGRVIQRCRLSSLPVFLATTSKLEDEVVISEAIKYKIDGVYRGSVTDVRSRFYECAKFFNLTNIARVTADNPFTEPSFITTGVSELESGFCYSRCNPRFCPEGTNVEVFSVRELEISIRSDPESLDAYDTEHVTPNMIERAKANSVISEFEPDLGVAKETADFSFTIDELKDYIKISRFCKNSRIKDADFASRSLLKIVSEKLIKNGEKDGFPIGHNH